MAKNKTEANNTVRSTTIKSLQKTGRQAGSSNVCKSKGRQSTVRSTALRPGKITCQRGRGSASTERGTQRGIWPSAPGTGRRQDLQRQSRPLGRQGTHKLFWGQHHTPPQETAQLVECPAVRDPKCHPTAHTTSAPAAAPSALDHVQIPGCRNGWLPQLSPCCPPLHFWRKGSPGSHRKPSLRAGRQVWHGDAPLLIPEGHSDPGRVGASRSQARPPYLPRSRRPQSPRGR